MENAHILTELYHIVKQNRPQEYPAIIEQKASYPYLYHLSGARQNLTDWLPLAQDMHVLERNAECGALTGNLLRKTGQVTCVTDDPAHADLIRERWRSEKSRLSVLTGEEWQAHAEGLERQYDVILLVGSFWRYVAELPLLHRLLRGDGKLIVADANRLGLKYFAGCQEEYQGGYFTGVEGSFAGEGRSFSRAEYETLLKDAGFLVQSFYYPYPDHRFPSTIYSEEWLPVMGELSENRRNFERDRLQLFDEGKAYDTLLAEGLFGVFSNSFLIVAEKQLQEYEKKLLYVRFSSERDRRFAIRTEIIADAAGEKYVQKMAIHPEATAHINGIYSMYERLTGAYAGSGIDFCGCKPAGAGVQFAFVEGRTLADALKEAVQQGDRVTAERILQAYIMRIGQAGGLVPFRRTEEFAQVFGSCVPEDGMECALASDIDMVFSNILLPEDGAWEGNARWTVIDYEWTFLFPVPKAFILYRGLYFAYHQLLGGMGWGWHKLLEMARITDVQAKVFAAMEVQFQFYLGQGALSVRNMQRRLGTRIFSLQEFLNNAGADSRGLIPESEWIRIRKILYHIDRIERQDGSMICSGWAFATAKDGRNLPVNIRVTDAKGNTLPAEVTRTERADVARQFKVRDVTHPTWGFDCVWLTQPGDDVWRVHFSLGNREKVYEP